MICKKPYSKDGQRYPCGQCLTCRLNRRRLITHRLILEAQLHEFSTFVTLTYSDEFVPAGHTLVPRHPQLWLKRLRGALGPTRPVRYYLVGEYGDETQRPHYHAVVFGLSALDAPTVLSTWGMGNVDLRPLTLELAQYCAGYVTKKMTSKDDLRLDGRHPEFARMSLRPGIGAGAVPLIADALNDSIGARHVATLGDVPTSLKHGSRSLPLGRYLRRKLREEMGFDEIGGQESARLRQSLEVLALSKAAGSTSAYLKERDSKERQKILQVEGKSKIFKKVSKL